MIVDETNAGLYRCCGPVGCGEVAPVQLDDPRPQGARFCLGTECMAWQVRAVLYTTPDGSLSTRNTLDNSWPETRLGCCGHAPDQGDSES